MARVTLQTIADRVGVSRMTVSNAFSRPDQLSEELRHQILAVAEELGYAGPDPTARALARGSTGAIGVLLTDSLRYAFTDEVATGFLGAIVDELVPTGLALTLLASAADADGTVARQVAIDGAIVYSCRPHAEAHEWLRRRRLPLVYVDQEPDPALPCVNVDDRGGARAAATHLVELGHRNIGIVTLEPVRPPEGHADDDGELDLAYPQQQRLAGWVEGLTAAGITPAVERAASHTVEAAADAARRLLSRPDRPTAVLSFSDVMGLGVLWAARDAGLDVPADLSVVGFDDSPAAHHSDPPLTTVHQDIEVKGRVAAAELLEAIEGAGRGEAPEPRHHLLATTLVERDTTAPPPAR